MEENKAGYSDKIIAEQIDEALDITRRFMDIAFDMTKLTLYQKYGIAIDGQESKKSDATKLSK